jgi:DNA polymerase I-like protein with 3'-5' exonuclease and polymerase domains
MLEAERQAVNTPIQGAASDFGLLSQVVIRDKILRGIFPRDLHQVYTVHDSIGYYIRPEHIHTLVPQIIEICNNPDTKKYFGFELKHVQMKVSPEVGKDWGDLTEYDPNEDYTKWTKHENMAA